MGALRFAGDRILDVVGGQTVQRYALSTALPPAIRTGLALRYVVANPSSYGYLDSTRPVYKCAGSSIDWTSRAGYRWTGHLVLHSPGLAQSTA